MSWWTYINGTVTVNPMGRTQAEKKYILDTVLNHLPLVTGSEGDMEIYTMMIFTIMEIYTIQKRGNNGSCSCDEFGYTTNNLIDSYGQKNRRGGWLRTQDEYILVVSGSFRDRMFKETLLEFNNWICRLAKRVDIEDVLVEIKGYDQSKIFRNTNDAYGKMFENPSWSKGKNEDNEPNWCEYLMWDRMKGCQYPMTLGYKYFNDEENDKEVERRMDY